MFGFFKRKPKYTQYEYSHHSYSLYPETKQVEDTMYSHGYGISDPLDVMTVETGRYFVSIYEIYIRRLLKTNLPQYKSILITSNGPFKSKSSAIDFADRYIKLHAPCSKNTNQTPKN